MPNKQIVANLVNPRFFRKITAAASLLIEIEADPRVVLPPDLAGRVADALQQLKDEVADADN